MATLEDHLKDCAQLTVHDEIIKVTLEDCPEAFTVSKALLCGSSGSDYFRRALDGKFQESETRTLTLPGCNEMTFRLWMHSAATGSLPKLAVPFETSGSVIPIAPATLPRAQDLQCALVRLWAFGDACLMPRLQNLAMDELIDQTEACYTTTKAIKLAFELSAMGSPIRLYLTQVVAYEWHIGELTGAEFEEMGRIPGFMSLFTDIYHGTDVQIHPTSGRFGSMGAREAYMVREDSKVTETDED